MSRSHTRKRTRKAKYGNKMITISPRRMKRLLTLAFDAIKNNVPLEIPSKLRDN